MTNSQELKNQLGKYTKQLENKLEPYQRGLLLISLTLFLLFSIYYLTKKETPKPRELTDQEKKQLEKLAEERILKRAEFLRRLQH